MENRQGNVNPKNDVLRSEHHSMLSAEEIEKAVARHNRKHKDDARKAVRQTTARKKK